MYMHPTWASQVVQWLRICLPMQETWVRSLIWEDSICRCYAQVAKSPSDHQGADIRCKSKRVFITKLELGLPPILTQRL